MRRFILHDRHTYSSFLSCLDDNSFSKKDLNRKAILGFLRDGILYHNQTFIEGLRKEFTHQVFNLDHERGFIDSSESIELEPKKDTSEEPLDAFVSFFKERREFLKGKKVSIDLTGGVDSRLIASVLSYLKIPFDAVFSLGAGSDEERKIVKAVSEQLGIKLDIIKVKDIKTTQELGSLFALSDGLWDIFAIRSLYEVQGWRKQKGYDLAITGVGGELYKDFWWQQDFPFYKSRKNRLARLLNVRFNRVSIQGQRLDEDMRSIVEPEERNIFDKMSELETSMNTKTYDQIYLHLKIKEQISVLSHAANSIIPTYSPLLESELLSIGYSLPRSTRFFNRFHRQVITKLTPGISQVRTTDGGMSVSSSPPFVARDIFKFVKTKTARVLALLSKRAEKQKPDLPMLIEERLKKSISLLKEADIFSKSAPEDYHEISRILWGRILTLGFVLEKIRQ
ncbi:asparagine synthase-related protein [Gracilimonas sp. BCB1]|uniref:asparagine synthase-related protein n=1 Tax=Gracilimonas sp. BCB1 TaxID=3152362 RepID=UPI0032D95744